MKRIGNLYKNICDINNIESAFKEVCKNTRNERRVFNMKQYKSIYISRVYNTLINKEYYLKFCFAKISEFLNKEKLALNGKSRLYKSTDNFMFLGRNVKGQYIRYRNTKRKLKAKRYLYETRKISLYSFCESNNCYDNLLKIEDGSFLKISNSIAILPHL